ncbi:putative potassium transporter 2 [Hibiscus syriacus]|uniref:Potassium transporter n=1 Tax=Hibiscus syriacus TaxID=106335 RepID=A0A6A2WYG2_HIBSY|nr:probable potassium transporter 13 [Hibiscus syriacus]KAE8667103.1 putative potassium transporter 2 [Hibiscus syriacus]
MDPEAGSVIRESRLKFYKSTLCLAYQSFGIVYGDLSSSPIYVYKSTFSGRLRLHEEDDEILGVLSLVFWTLTLIPLCKYIIFVLGADDNGEGGTFALYSLLCRHAKLGLLSPSNAPDDDISAYDYGPHRKETVASSILKEFFHKYHSSRIVLLLLVLLGTSMVIGDGILTPSMSVLAAVNGIKVKAPSLHGNYTVFVACVILVGLFALQHFGTSSVGFLFAPILLAWLFCISTVGVYNTIYWNPRIVRALSPYYVYNFFKKAGKDGWSSLGGVVLCITGAEAMFADLGHFSKLSIRLAFTVVYPCLIVAYMGEAAYLSKNKEDLQRSFYKAIPEVVFWPVFIIATLATMVGSQAIISATFSIISQCRALKCFPRVKVVHTSNHIHGQIYIPEANWILMFLCLAVVVGYRDTDMIGNAYGLAVITVMLVTTCLMFLVIVMVWKRNIFRALAFAIFFGSVELLYFSACLGKVHKGGWLPLIFSLIVLSTMCIWHYGTMKKQAYESNNKINLDMLLSMGPNLGINRVPGLGLIYSNVATGAPPMFSHFVTNFPAFHRILIFVTVQSLTVPKVPANQRFVISRICPPEYRLFQCVVRYGYKDQRKDSHDFENLLIETISEFLQRGNNDSEACWWEPVNQQESSTPEDVTASTHESGVNTGSSKKTVRFRGVGCNKELEDLKEARESGLAYMMGSTCVLACDTSSYLKKLAINFVYRFLRQNCRHPATALGIPHTSLIEVGMVYRV